MGQVTETSVRSFAHPQQGRSAAIAHPVELPVMFDPFPLPEQDPHDTEQHAPGVKLDDGKVDMTYLMDWPNALAAVCRVSEYGTKKYTRGGWKSVPDGFARYTRAMLRHLFGIASDDGLDHDAQVAWNALSRLELKLAAKSDKG